MAPNGQKPLAKALICLLLAGVTVAAFAGVANAGFIVFDDGNYVVDHPAIQHGFSWKTIEWAFSSFDSSNWHPLTWLSLMLDYHLFGLHPGGYHLSNLAFHVVSTVLLFLLLERLTAKVWPSAFVALLFGIHPMHVESVAWVSERKDVLSAFFFLLTLISYSRYALASDEAVASQESALLNKRPKRGPRQAAVPSPLPSDGRGGGQGEVRDRAKGNPPSPSGHRWLLYALTLFLFVLGLMSKPMLVTLPFVLLLLDFWPLQRFDVFAAIKRKKDGEPAASKRSEDGSHRSWAMADAPRRSAAKTGQRLFAEKIPFLILSAFSCYLTYLAQKSGGAVRQATEYSILQRLWHVPVSYAWYMLKLLWPVNLSIYYELHPIPFGLEFVLASLLLIVLTWFALATFRKYPYLLFGWLWFLGLMIPVIGIVQVGSQAYADRYTYLPYIGLFIIIAWGVPDLVAGTFKSSSSSPSPARHSLGDGGSSIPPSSARAFPAILCASAIAVAVACIIRTVQEVGFWKNGVTLFKRTLALDPKNETAWTLLGAEYSQRGKYAEALDCLNRALALDERFYLAWGNIGYVRSCEGDYVRAAEAYEKALNYTQSNAIRTDIYNNLGQAYKMATNYNGAISAFQSSLTILSNQPKVQTALGQCLLESKQPAQAAAAFQAAVDLDPGNAVAQLGLGTCFASAGRDADALAHFRAAVQADTNSVTALGDLAWTLAADADPSLRDGPQAVSLAEHACELTHYQNAQSIGTLAAAYAEAGRFDDAIAAARKARDVAQAQGEKEIADRNAQLLKLYEAHKAFHMADGK